MNIKNLEQYKYLILEKDYLKENIEYHHQVLEKLKLRFNKCNNELKEIQFFINDIDDDRFKQIIYMKYIEKRTWLDISLFFGSSDESYSRNLLNKYLKKYNEKQ